MNDLERLNDIAIELKMVNENIEWRNKIQDQYSHFYKADLTKLEIQIKDLENRRKRIVRRMFNQYCK